MVFNEQYTRLCLISIMTVYNLQYMGITCITSSVLNVSNETCSLITLSSQNLKIVNLLTGAVFIAEMWCVCHMTSFELACITQTHDCNFLLMNEFLTSWSYKKLLDKEADLSWRSTVVVFTSTYRSTIYITLTATPYSQVTEILTEIVIQCPSQFSK